MTGPEITGCRPIMVAFNDFSEREEVYKRSALLKGTSLYISEDIPRYEEIFMKVLSNFNTLL